MTRPLLLGHAQKLVYFLFEDSRKYPQFYADGGGQHLVSQYVPHADQWIFNPKTKPGSFLNFSATL